MSRNYANILTAIWRQEILTDPTASERLRQMVSADPGQPLNGRHP